MVEKGALCFYFYLPGLTIETSTYPKEASILYGSILIPNFQFNIMR